jgi:Xaa-Pro aminopeptidase
MALPFKSSEYISRQEGLFAELPESTVLIIPTNDRMIRSNDVEYPFRANSYILYLCGWEEEGGVFVANNTNGSWATKLFVTPRDTKKEIWEGIRIGVDGATEWPVDFADSLDNLSPIVSELIADSDHIFTIQGVSRSIDGLISNVAGVSDPREIIDPLRRIKSSKEIEHMKEAARIGSEAHIIAMKSAFPGIGEWQIQSSLEGHFIDSMSRWSFPSIVGGGSNGTILHYKSNNCIVKDGDLVLVDAGCEINGYASDITRTWPVNGKFSEPQREIYDLVLNAQMAGINSCQPGSPWDTMHRTVSIAIAQGLIDLGVLECTLQEALGDEESLDGPFRNFFMHGTGHLLGLDVHDVGGGRQGDSGAPQTLEPGMVLTIEPGLYFGGWREDIDVPDRYRDIGVRIEDDVLITENGPVVLTSSCPKEVQEIEKILGAGV